MTANNIFIIFWRITCGIKANSLVFHEKIVHVLKIKIKIKKYSKKSAIS